MGIPTVNTGCLLWEAYDSRIGQYYFWKLMPCEKRDIDELSNSNVLFILGEGEKYERAFVD